MATHKLEDGDTIEVGGRTLRVVRGILTEDLVWDLEPDKLWHNGLEVDSDDGTETIAFGFSKTYDPKITSDGVSIRFVDNGGDGFAVPLEKLAQIVKETEDAFPF